MYTSFSASDIGQSCTDTRNCSQKVCHSRTFPLKVGMSSLGNLTPELSLVVKVVEVVGGSFDAP